MFLGTTSFNFYLGFPSVRGKLFFMRLKQGKKLTKNISFLYGKKLAIIIFQFAAITQQIRESETNVKINYFLIKLGIMIEKDLPINCQLN